MEFKLMLAPLEDITGNAFRAICHKYGADLTFTEMTRISSLVRDNKSTIERIRLKDDTPTIIQLFGSKEEQFREFIKNFKPEKEFRGFNLNIGCPSPQLVRIGQGCAMIRKVSKTKRIIDIIKENGYEASVKMRLGITQRDKENKIYLNLINGVDADYFIVHARHGTQTYSDKADFSVYEECVKTGKIIIANGDIKTKEQIEYLQRIGVKGAMIGREAVRNPAIFNQLKGLSHPPKEEIMNEFLKLSESYQEDERYRKNVIKHITGTLNFTER
jgi:tRNA-dihydrouridine synthase B